MDPYEKPDNLSQFYWDCEKLLLKEVIRALEHISKQLTVIYMEIPS